MRSDLWILPGKIVVIKVWLLLSAGAAMAITLMMELPESNHVVIMLNLQVTRKQKIVERKVKGAPRKLGRLPVMIVVMIVPVMIVQVLAIVRVCWRCTLMHKM